MARWQVNLTFVVLPLLTACSDFEATVAIFRVGNVVSGCLGDKAFDDDWERLVFTCFM
jgi:hypothetical protein